MGRTGSHEEMVPLTPKPQWISLTEISGPVLLACEPIAACSEMLYLFFLFIYLKMSILMIYHLFGFFFSPAGKPCWGHPPRPSICAQGVWPALCRGCPFPWQPALCVQHPNPLPVNIHIQLILTWSLELFEMSCLGKERDSAQWRHLSFCEKPCLLRVLGRGRNSHPGPE